MNAQENPPELLVMCAVLIVFSVAGILAGFSRELLGTLDGLLMLAVCLMIALIFILMLYLLAKEQGWFKKHHDGGGSAAPTAGAK
jgi:hypothetical protein